MDNCAKCGKELISFLDKHMTHSAIDRKCRNNEWKGKKLCRICAVEIAYPENVKICSTCGERYVDLHRCKGATSAIGKICTKCGYCDEQRVATGIAPAFVGNAVLFNKNYKCRKFSLDINSSTYHAAEKCSSYVTKEEYTKKCLSGEMDKEKANVQIVLDFSSLKDVMSKGGLVMSTYKCPNCNGMVDIPEAGKVLVCKYCNTPIKPVDIFEKIKTLIQ
ncbi:MAG: hypothetical protein V1850_03785 [Candidatus Bathyarchaeota archaeon]